MHVKKFTQKEYEKVLRHCIRTIDKDGNYNKRTNSNIDFDRTCLNFSFEKDRENIKDIKNYIKELSEKYPIRNSRTIVMASWVLQTPNDFEGDINIFFKNAYEILKGRYPETINGFVHLDETTPHMHFLFCPIKDGKFNAKAVLTKDELNNMHDWMESELNKRGIECELTKAETKERKRLLEEVGKDAELFEYDERPEYLPMEELKRRTQTKILKDYEEERKRFEEYKKYVDDYKSKNLDIILQEKTEYVPKAEVQNMLQQLIEMLERDLGKERTEKYRKFLESFGYIFRKVVNTITELIKDKKDR